uniref:Uncharacterized protein n=1 Tax=Oryza sativa subsp. japonica TaxID=39947 RepID=Q6YV91_ORYSJ|nr:hypothetical protein [Oryza sativa Japonica Group]
MRREWALPLSSAAHAQRTCEGEEEERLRGDGPRRKGPTKIRGRQNRLFWRSLIRREFELGI